MNTRALPVSDASPGFAGCSSRRRRERRESATSA
jgi:hypothetical protein